jgi:ferredoxin
MTVHPGTPAATAVIDRDGLQAMLDALAARGYAVLGPTVRDGAVVYDRIEGLRDLPAGWTDRHEAGRYRLERRADDALFGFNVGPHSWKRFLLPPSETIFRAKVAESGMEIAAEDGPPARLAFIGVRACELAAIAVQDKVLCDGPYPDARYASRRHGAFLVAVNCGQAGATCFCASMQTGPKADAGFDIALTELLDETRHGFLVETGSEAGAELLRAVPHRPAGEADLAAAGDAVRRAEAQMGRRLQTEGLKEKLQASLDHPRWDQVAERCLTCGNCTMVCPTCFCTTVEDHSDLAGTTAERVRKWDSCFTMDFSYIHGGSVRPSARSRYRQWMTHKLANWHDQFGSSGCVGCGRCITWCPVGIDITEEAAAIASGGGSKGGHP